MRRMRNCGWVFILLQGATLQLCYGQQERFIPVIWKTGIPGDFSFIQTWSYKENVFRNEFNELVCDGFCLPEIWSLRDSTGRIIPDSVEKYYTLLDTAHYFHNFSCSSTCPEFAGTDFMSYLEADSNTHEFASDGNAATHCSVHLKITGDSCAAWVTLVSILKDHPDLYRYESGYIEIEPVEWKAGKLKSSFDMYFINADNPEDRVRWRGLTYIDFSQ